MITLNSRYAPPQGLILNPADARTTATVQSMAVQPEGTGPMSVVRDWRYVDTSASYFRYQWVSGDRVDSITAKAGLPPTAFHRVLDLNPEISDPMAIRPGTYIRIPYA